MTENTYILAVDPGNEKTGVAIVTPDGAMVCRNIISTKTFNDDIERLLTEYYGIVHIVCGNGTNHKHLYPSLQQIGRNHKITTSLIDESHSTEEARKLYWKYNPPTGWRKFLPTSMQFPPEPVDDLTALVIGLRYTKQLTQSKAEVKEETISSSELEEKRLRCVMMILGAFIYTVGLDLFLVPNSIIDGGVVGISLMAAELSGISFSIFVVLINLPFLYLGYKAIGKGFTLSTLFSIVWMAIFSNFAHDFTPITTDPFLGSIFGGIILGIGVGLIIRNGGSLDGSEIVAIIWDKKSTFSVGEIVMAMNLIILGAAGFVYSWNSAMYSLIAYFLAYKMIDVTITGLEESKGVMIITDADNSKDIADALNANLNRGVTIMYGEGGYLKQPKHILYSVVTRLEITRLKDTVYEVDPAAFITIQDVHDVFGGRFTKGGH